MQKSHLLIALLLGVLSLVVAAWPAVSQDAAKKEPAKKTSLREPGFVFLELGVENVSLHVEFFETVAGFKTVVNEGNWAWIQSERGDLMFGPGIGVPNKGKPPETKRVNGVEIGVVVADLDKTYELVTKFKDKGFRMAGKIERRPWGPRDFRVFTPDGYYVRITEPM